METDQNKNLPASSFFTLDSLGNEISLQKDSWREIENQFSPAMIKVITANVDAISTVQFSSQMDTMQKLELVDYEPASDKGHFRFYPKGALMYELLTRWCEQIATEAFEALPLKTPFIYDWDHSNINKQIGMFSNSVYPVFGSEQNKEKFVLRFNDDLGLFEIMKGAQLTYRHLPFRIYEHTHSFRYHQSGALSGIRRGRSFSFTDIHSFCSNMEEALIEYQEIQRLLTKMANDVGVNLVIHFKITENLYKSMKNVMIEMLASGEKMLVEIISSQRQYWSMKHISYSEHPQTLFHVQFDIESGKKFGIKYMTNDGDKNECVVIHTSFGSIEKWMIIAVDDALKKESPTLPLWLSPTQVRIIPVSQEKHLDFSLNVAEQLKSNQIRVDVDDRSESLNWRIRAAEREWVPYTVVCGDKEISDNYLAVRVRGENQRHMIVAELKELIRQQTQHMPFRPLPGMLVSKRPVFKGRD